MFSEHGYFDPRHDPNHNHVTPPVEVKPHQGAAYDANIKDTLLSCDDDDANVFDQLQHQLDFNLEQELHSYLLEDMPSIDHAAWEPTIHQQLYHEQGRHTALQPSGPCYDTVAEYPDSQILNILQLPSCTLSFSKLLTSLPVDMLGELPGRVEGSSVLYDPSLHLGYPPPPQGNLLSDLFHSLPQSYGLSFGVEERDVAARGEGPENEFQEMDGRQYNTVLDYTRDMGALGNKGVAKGNFLTERQRRDQFNEKYRALRSLIPNPTKADRASIVGDAIEHINELQQTIIELKLLVEKKRHGKERRRMLKADDETPGDVESSPMRPHIDDHDRPLHVSLRSPWLQGRSEESRVDVRVMEDEVNIELSQKKKPKHLLFVAKALDDLQLDLIHVSGGNIGEHYIFIFNTKKSEGSSAYASAIAKKLLEVMDEQHTDSTLLDGF